MSTRSLSLYPLSFRLAFAALVAGLCLSLVARAERIKPQPIDGNIEWVYDYEEGKELARKNGKPLFVVIRCEI